MLIVSNAYKAAPACRASIHSIHSIHPSIYNIIVSLCCRNSIHIAVYLAIQ